MTCNDLFEPDGQEKKGEFYVATQLAVANGNVLLLQCKEILKYNHHTANYVQEPLKSLFSEIQRTY